MKTLFPKQECHVPKWFVIDAKGQTLGRLATVASKLLRGKETALYTPGVDQGNFVVILNADKVTVTGQKENEKLYYRNSQRPGNLKIETFKDLQQRIPYRIVEEAIWGMLPKGVLGRNYYRRLHVYLGDQIQYKKTKDGSQETVYCLDPKISHAELFTTTNWIKVDL
jgi:large subunit ribosomal protein L13